MSDICLHDAGDAARLRSTIRVPPPWYTHTHTQKVRFVEDCDAGCSSRSKNRVWLLRLGLFDSSRTKAIYAFYRKKSSILNIPGVSKTQFGCIVFKIWLFRNVRTGIASLFIQRRLNLSSTCCLIRVFRGLNAFTTYNAPRPAACEKFQARTLHPDLH
jgi:hypothetical protein